MSAPAAPFPSLSRPGLGAEVRALWAVMYREWLLFVRYPSWIVAQFVWPVLFPAGYILLARALAGPDGGSRDLFAGATGTGDYTGYIVVGTTVWMWQNISLWHIGMTLRGEQLRGTLETNWLTPARRIWFLLGSGILQGVLLGATVVLSALEFGLVFGVRFAGSPWLALLVFLAATPSVYGLGLAFASVVIAAKEANAFVFLVRGLVMVFCGITFPLSLLPGWMQPVAAWLPPTYIIRAARAAALQHASLAQLRPDLTALLLFGLFWVAAGLGLFAWMDARARRTGSIGHY